MSKDKSPPGLALTETKEKPLYAQKQNTFFLDVYICVSLGKKFVCLLEATGGGGGGDVVVYLFMWAV